MKTCVWVVFSFSFVYIFIFIVFYNVLLVTYPVPLVPILAFTYFSSLLLHKDSYASILSVRGQMVNKY